jgi:hypothetical protein
VLLLATAMLTAGCESTQEKSARLAAQAKDLAKPEEGLKITEESKVVEVGATAVLRDQNGAAAVVELRNTGNEPLAAVPVAIDVLGPGKKSLFRNDVGGTEPSLVSAALLRPSETMFWVHDQVVVSEQPKSVRAAVGADAKPVPGEIPEIAIDGVKLEDDPTSGTAAVGTVENRSEIEQRQLVIYAVARDGERIVAGGRGQVPRLKPGAKAPFAVYFIGDPRAGDLTLAAPPTNLNAGS